MSREILIIRWSSLVALVFLSGAPARCDDPPPASTADHHQYKTLQINSGGKPVTIRVRQEPDPIKHATFQDDLDHQRAFSETNDMANRSFMTTPGTGWNKAADLKARDAFAAKPYAFDNTAPTAPNLGTKATFRSTPFKATTANGFATTFPTSAAASNPAAVLGAGAAPEQNRSSAFNGKSVDVHSASFANKTFQGPEAEAIHKHLTRLDNGQIGVTELPDRPLSIDEVRDLLNHGFKPDTSQPPPEASKAMNDPDYVPKPLREEPSAGEPRASQKVNEDDKDDAVPPPGTMGGLAPENSEPLPKK